MSDTSIVSNRGWPVLVDSAALLGSTAPSRKPPPPLRPRPIGKRTRPRPGYVDAGRASIDLSCEVGEVERIARAEGVATEEAVGAITFSVADLELAADRRRPARPLPAPHLTPDDSRAGERLADAAERLGMGEAELTAAVLGRVPMTTKDGEVYLRSRDLKRIEAEQGLGQPATHSAAPSPLAPPPPDPRAEERTEAAARALGIDVAMQPEQGTASDSRHVKANRERTRLGKPRRWGKRW